MDQFEALQCKVKNDVLEANLRDAQCNEFRESLQVTILSVDKGLYSALHTAV